MKIATVKLYGTTDESGDLVITRGFEPAIVRAVEWIVSEFDSTRQLTLSCVNTESGIDSTLNVCWPATEGGLDYLGRPERHKLANGDLRLTVENGGANKNGGCIVYYEA